MDLTIQSDVFPNKSFSNSIQQNVIEKKKKNMNTKNTKAKKFAKFVSLPKPANSTSVWLNVKT